MLSPFLLSPFLLSLFLLYISLFRFALTAKGVTCILNVELTEKKVKMKKILKETASLNREFGNRFKLGFKPRAAGVLPTWVRVAERDLLDPTNLFTSLFFYIYGYKRRMINYEVLTMNYEL